MRKSVKTKKLKLTGREQIGVMEGLTGDAAGWLAGKTSRMLRSWVGAPRSGSMWNGRDLVGWLVARAKGEGKAAASEGLERERVARGRLKELEVGKAEGSLISRAEVHVAMGTLAMVLRGVGARLLKECGGGAAAILDEGMADFEREVGRAFGEVDGGRWPVVSETEGTDANRCQQRTATVNSKQRGRKAPAPARAGGKRRAKRRKGG